MAVGIVAVTAYMHMTRTDGSRGNGSDDKRDQWHMHMTMTVGVLAVTAKEISCGKGIIGICT